MTGFEQMDILLVEDSTEDAEMTLRALTQLGPGSVVDMGRSPDAPVQLLVGSQVVAQGEVVVVGGNYGVRITHLVSPADRLRAMEL